VDSQQARTVWQRYWPVDLLAVVVVALVLIFGTVLSQRTSDAKQLARTLDKQTQRQRQAICAILANIPGQVPPEIINARRVFARPGHPDDCQPLPHSSPSPSPTPRPTPAPTMTRTVFVVPAQGGASATPPTGAPPASRTASPRPTPTRTASPSPSPTRCRLIRRLLHRC
jgi:hypothetical protein